MRTDFRSERAELREIEDNSLGFHERKLETGLGQRCRVAVQESAQSFNRFTEGLGTPGAEPGAQGQQGTRQARSPLCGPWAPGGVLPEESTRPAKYQLPGTVLQYVSFPQGHCVSRATVLHAVTWGPRGLPTAGSGSGCLVAMAEEGKTDQELADGLSLPPLGNTLPPSSQASPDDKEAGAPGEQIEYLGRLVLSATWEETVCRSCS